MENRTLETIVKSFASLHVTSNISLRFSKIQSHVFKMTARVTSVYKKKEKNSLYENLYCKLLEEN